MKHTHTEGLRSILKSRFARGVVPLAAAFLACALAAPKARAAVPADFAKTFTVTVPAGLVDAGETLTSFPLLLRLGTGILGFNYADFRQAGADILVEDASGNALPYELENWDTAGESRLWVRVPSVAAGTTLTVYYGTKETVVPLAGVWSGYAGVWHLNEAGDGATTIADSTANKLDGTSHASSKARSDGKLGAARGLELTGKNGAMTTVPSSAILDALVPTFTVSGWVRPSTLAMSWGYLFARKTSDSDPSWGLQFRASDNANSVGIYSNGNADNDSNRAMFTTSGKFTAKTWTKYHVVYDNTTIRFYLDGALVASKSANPGPAVSKSNGFGIGGFPTSANHSSLYADQDEVRLMNGAASAAWVAAEYRQESGSVPLSYGKVCNTDATAPNLAIPVLSRDLATGAFTVSAELSENVPASVVCDADGVTNAMTTADVALPMTYSAAISGLSANTTYACLVSATSTGGTVTESVCPTAFYNGDISIEKISDADENGLVPGVFRISRADTAHDLVVAYTVGGTAIAGQTYAALSGTATIPAGSNSVDVAVAPLLDAQTTSDTTVSAALVAGLYGIDAQAGSAEMTVVNLAAPTGFNTWVAPSAGLASVGSNWSEGHAPLATENVLFDGRFSTANCEWDAAASATVASWTQTNDYTGVITLDTVYPGKGDFQCLTVTGPMAVMCGTITHPQSRTLGQSAPDYLQDLLDNETYRVRIDAGSLTIGENGRIDTRNKGYYQSSTGNITTPAPSHGGRLSASGLAPYDDVKEPIHVGLPYMSSSGGYYRGIGGGAVYLTSTGAVVVDGYIGADTGSDTWNRNLTLREGAAAGSVYVRGATVSGTGTISASALATAEQSRRGVGGRVAVIATSSTPIDYTTLQLKATVYPFNNNNGQSSTYGGCGTVFIKDATQTYGTLLLQNVDGIFAPTIERCTPVITEGDWTFDAIGLGNRAVLSVPVGASLHLPNGLASVFSLNAADSTAYGSIRYEGGTLDLGSSTDQTMTGNWMLTPWTNLTLNANVTVKGGAAVGVPTMADILDNNAANLPAFVSCNLTVNGDLTVESDGKLLAKGCGLKKDKNSMNNGFGGVLPGHTHGGRCLFFKGFDAQLRYYTGYDSVFAPCLPGNSVPYPNGQSAEASGGVITLAVTGALTLDGEANANGMLEIHKDGGNCSGGTGGAIDIMAGTLSGAGQIVAEAGSKQAQRGSGGRIAIKLTSPGADFSNFSGKISASGRVRGSGGPADSSAGTVYLQTAADGEKGGTVIIAMSEGNRAANNTNTTEMVSLGYGGDAVVDYRKVKYVVRDYGRAAVNADMKAASIEIADAYSSLDLEGHILTVNSATVNGVRLSPGTYAAESDVAIGEGTLGDYLVDTGTDGELIVGGVGLSILVR